MPADFAARMKTPAGAKPFLFDRSFDRTGDRTRASKPGAPAPEQENAPDDAAAAPEPEPEAPSFSEDDLAAARAEGVEEGRAQALEEARLSREASNGETLARLEAALGDIDARARAARADSEAQLLRFAETAFKRLMPAYAEAHGEAEILAVLREVAALILGEAALTVRLRPDRLSALEPALHELTQKAGYDGRLTLIGDAALGASDVVVDWGDGQAARRLAEAETALARALDETMATLTRGDAAAPDPEPAPGPEPEPDTQTQQGTEAEDV